MCTAAISSRVIIAGPQRQASIQVASGWHIWLNIVAFCKETDTPIMEFRGLLMDLKLRTGAG
jgi:hypothetical protein